MRNTVKKLFALLLVMTLLLSSAFMLFSCSDDADDDQSKSSSSQSTSEPSPTVYDINISYDDRYTFEKDVTSIENATITSKQARTENADTSLIEFVGESKTQAIARGIGTATVVFADGSRKTIKVSPAKINVLLIIGQSNAEGADGNASLSIRCDEGMVYSTYAPAYYYKSGFNKTFIEGENSLFSEFLLGDNGARYVAKTLTSDKNIAGDSLEYKLNSLTKAGIGKGGIDSAIADEWVRETGEKVWVVNCAHSGSSIKLWNSDYDDSNVTEAGKSDSQKNQYSEMSYVMNAVKGTMESEITAGHYELSHYGFFWVQGESDWSLDPKGQMSAFEYQMRFLNMYSSIKDDFAINNKQMEFAAIISTRTFRREYPYNGANGVYLFADTALNGPRLAQFYMGLAGGDCEDVYLVSNAGDRWVSSEIDNHDFVIKYFNDVYQGDNVSFKERFGYDFPDTMQKLHWAGPHYTQYGYNEIGVDAVRNLLDMKGWYKDESCAVILASADGQYNIPCINKLMRDGYDTGANIEEFINRFSSQFYTWKP